MSAFENLENRTLEFASAIVALSGSIPKTIATIEILKQLIRSAASIGANYREANEKLSKKDFLLRVKIARKEAKETVYWLKLLRVACPDRIVEIDRLETEAGELRYILSAILSKSTI